MNQKGHSPVESKAHFLTHVLIVFHRPTHEGEAASDSQQLNEAMETIESMERKAAIEKLRMKKQIKQMNDSQAKLIRENAKLARNLEKVDSELQEKTEQIEKLQFERERVGRQKKDLEHFMEKRLKDSRESSFCGKRANLSDKAVLVALPTSYEQSLEQQIVDLKNNLESETEFFKRIGQVFPNLGLFGNVEIKKVFREKLKELRSLRERAKVSVKIFNFFCETDGKYLKMGNI